MIMHMKRFFTIVGIAAGLIYNYEYGALVVAVPLAFASAAAWANHLKREMAVTAPAAPVSTLGPPIAGPGGRMLMPVPGPVLAAQAYREPSLRGYGDLDLLVRQRDIRRAWEVNDKQRVRGGDSFRRHCCRQDSWTVSLFQARFKIARGTPQRPDATLFSSAASP